ncbi:Cfr10I/Bse634I family restriction endonuclease [Vibrio ordalii]|uniref:Cfr10I/Bse634I family restriction endonuclease n=1 Tax=Vibrio ordalii TaxID=28174 RepID=UPI000300D906|nr:Cfr10I/Bse634I family restriction endonuclease [Vibrio ordalii]OEE79313.1 type II site-specific deoxyribonuclease [Vibrio ordalii FF-167]
MAKVITYDRNKKPKINMGEAFCYQYKSVPTGNWDYETSLDDLGAVVKKHDSSVSREALSNTRGQWFEWMVSIDLYNYWLENDQEFLILNLPNIVRFDSASLYVEEIYGFVKDLREKLSSTLDISLVTSNPDYVIIDTTRLRYKLPDNRIQSIDLDTFHFIDEIYKCLIGSCELDDIVGYFSLKTSLRPDRRLQIAHEGSLTKATYVHLQTRSWLMEPRGIKYFGAAMKLSDADINGLKTVATHSITTVMSKPEKAVDMVFTIKARTDLYHAVNEMICLIET